MWSGLCMWATDKTTAQIKLSPLQQRHRYYIQERENQKVGIKAHPRFPTFSDALNCPKTPEGISFTYKCNKQKQRITFETPGAAEKKNYSSAFVCEAKDLLKLLLETARSIVKFYFFPLFTKKKKCSYYYSKNKCETDAKVHPLWIHGGDHPEQFQTPKQN